MEPFLFASAPPMRCSSYPPSALTNVPSTRSCHLTAEYSTKYTTQARKSSRFQGIAAVPYKDRRLAKVHPKTRTSDLALAVVWSGRWPSRSQFLNPSVLSNKTNKSDSKTVTTPHAQCVIGSPPNKQVYQTGSY